MEPIRIRVTRIMDFGTIVSIVGVDLDSNKPVLLCKATVRKRVDILPAGDERLPRRDPVWIWW